MVPKILAEPVLVGRERELEELQRCLNLAIEGKGTTVFISAEAGTGKSRLISEFVKAVKQKKETTCLTACCLFNACVPYFPFIEAFSGYYSALSDKSEKEESELNSWLKGPAKAELAGQLQHLSPQALKDQTFAAVAEAIHSIAIQSPVILLLEDIHWADSASLALIHYIARAINHSERVLLLATFRSEELTTNLEGYPHQLVETLAMMRREDLFDQISLPNLNQACVTEMVESMLGGTLQQALAEKLAVKSEGNPLFVVESLRMLHEQNNILQEDNEWRLAVEEIEIPSKMRDIIVQRLARLNSIQRRILDAASVIGEEFDIGLLSATVEEDILDVLETLNSVAHSTALIRPDENRYRFDHARSREIIYQMLAEPLRQGYHRKIGEKLENARRDELCLSDLAFHYAECGDKPKSLRYAQEAGKDELAKSSNVQAIKHFRYVLENVTKEQVQERRTALEGLGEAYAACYLFEEAIKSFDELATSASGAIRLRAIRKAMSAAFIKGDKPDLLLEYARKAEVLAVEDRLEMARIRSNRARAIGWSGRGDVKLELAEFSAALKVFEEENSLVDIAEGLWRNGAVCLFFEDLRKKGLGQLLRSVAIYREIGYIRQEIQASVWAGDGFIACGLGSEAEHKLNDALKMGEKMDVFPQLAGAQYYLGIIAERDGKFLEALQHSLKSLEYAEKTDANFLLGFAYASLVRQYSKLGDLNNADIFLGKLTKLPQEILSQVLLAPMILISKGVYFAAKGLQNQADQIFERLAVSVSPTIENSIMNVARPSYAWTLEKQGRLHKARVQREMIAKQLQQTKEKFQHVDIQPTLTLPRKVQVGEEFIIRLDLVNVSRSTCSSIKVESLVPPSCKVNSMSPVCQAQNGSLQAPDKIDPFQVTTITLNAVFQEPGIYNLEPTVFCIDDLGCTRTTRVEPIKVTATPIFSKIKVEKIPELKNGKFNFRSEAAEKAFNYLVIAFQEDHFRRKLPEEKSGWRALMEISRNAHIPKYSMYGRHGRGGEATRELRLLEVVESRLFLGERGRGGRALKMRVRYEKLEHPIDE